MDYKHFLGVDISKGTLDFCLLTDEGVITFGQSENKPDLIIEAIRDICSSNGAVLAETLLCAEYTGHYGKHLVEASLRAKFQLWLEHPAQIKMSQGMQRGKDDRKDAERIAVYAKRFSEKATLVTVREDVFEELAYLTAERDLLVTDRAKYSAQLKDEKGFAVKGLYEQKRKRYEKLIKQLDRSIKEIEEHIEKLIDKDDTLKRQYEILTSVDGIGKQVAVQTIVATKGFTKFSEARKFACHVGCAPFKYHSGSSIRSRNKVSHRANKKLKQLYHMAALSVVRSEGVMKEYFERKVAEGKNKMTVINAIRAKLIATIFALIRDNRKYEKIYTTNLG